MAATAAGLSDIHRDPADRFIIATALLTGRQLLTLDGVIAQYPELAGKSAACHPSARTSSACMRRMALRITSVALP